MPVENYYKVKLRSMGSFATPPADGENWQAEYTSYYFEKMFGFGKGGLVISTLDDGMQHIYYPEYYFDKLYKYIEDINKKDYKLLSKKLNTFYSLKEEVLLEIPKISDVNFSQLSNEELIDVYKKNRDYAHRFTVYDQFGWTAEEYWIPLMENILVKKLGIQKNSSTYHNVLFTLTKPEEISTTLKEKRDFLLEVIKIKGDDKNIEQSSQELCEKYGWMPVFAYGTPWDEAYYIKQLQDFSDDINKVKQDYENLKSYTTIRNDEFNRIVNKYDIKDEDLQVFVDFGLALDTRNEAEYLVSLVGYHLIPIYKEMAKRLYFFVDQIRMLYESEIIECLEEKIDPHTTLMNKGKICAWGFNREMTKRYNFNEEEALGLFEYAQKMTRQVDGGNVNIGICANIGKVVGKVKIVTHPKDNDKVENGDILITHTTTVDYLPAMKKAAAFITEMGGLTCHAAVVSREFGVPCVVSLKNATLNFRDGDEVEVDADKGIVKIIN